MHDEYIDRMVFDGMNNRLNTRLMDMKWADVRELKIPYENHLLPNFPEGGFKSDELLSDLVDNKMLGKDPEAPYRNRGKSTAPVLLEDVIVWIQKNRSKVVLEIECKDAGMAPFLRDVLDRTDSFHWVILMSGDTSIVEEYQDYFVTDGHSKDVKLGANIRHLDASWKRRLEHMELFEVGLDPADIIANDIDYLYGRGIRVLSNLGDCPELWGVIRRSRVDGFKTNYFREYTSWLAEQSG